MRKPGTCRYRRWIREQHGSYVAQTAGIALFVTVVVTMLFAALPGMRGRVQQLLDCEIGKYSGGGGCGTGAVAQNGTGPNWQVFHSAPIGAPPQPGTNAPAPEPAPQPQPIADRQPQPVKRCDEGLLAGAPSADPTDGVVPIGLVAAPSAAPPASCDARCHFLGLLDGLGEGVWDTIKGLGALGWDLWYLATGDEGTWAKYQTLIASFVSNPILVAQELLGALAEPIIADWNAGCYGRASGRLLFEVLTTIGGPKGLDKLAKLGLLDELGDLGAITRRIPCLGAVPTGKAPGLAKPLADDCRMSKLPIVKPGQPAWRQAVKDLQTPGRGKNYRVTTEDEARQLLREAHGDIPEYLTYTTDPYKRGFEVHPEESKTHGAPQNDLPHIKWQDWTHGKKGGSEGHIFFD